MSSRATSTATNSSKSARGGSGSSGVGGSIGGVCGSSAWTVRAMLAYWHLLSLLVFVRSLEIPLNSSNGSSAITGLVTTSSLANKTRSEVVTDMTAAAPPTTTSSSSRSSTQSRSSSSTLDSPWTSCPASCTCSMTASVHLGESLKTVNCSSRNLRTVPRGVAFDAETLILNHNQLSDLHEQLPQLEHLIHLDISSNQLKQLGRGHIFMNFTRLRHLDLSANEFKTLFAGVFRGLKRLEVLLMRDGALRYIDEHAFDGLENLRTLDLQSNHITSVYLELFQSILNLHVLNLGHNSISHLTGGIFASLNGLRTLVLSENRITGINDNAFVGLDTLEDMELRDNFLSRVPSVALQSLKRLRSLDLGGNSLQGVQTGDFVHTPAQVIFIDHCPEMTIVDRGAFWDLPNLRVLHVHSNPRLQFIDSQAFLGVPSLSELYAQNNSMFTLQEDMVLNLVQHREQLSSAHGTHFGGRLKLAINANPLLCDCNIRYLNQCLRNGSSCKVDLLSADDIRCASPSQLKGTKVSELYLAEAPPPPSSSPSPALQELDGPSLSISSVCPPTLLTTGPKNGTVHKKIGERHVFQCRALGAPPPRIHWVLPSGELLNETSNSVHLQLKTPGSLRLFHLKPRDSGQYTCVAENHAGAAAAVQNLAVDNIDLHIWPLGVSATFVTVVWNGTARNLFPEYQLLYRVDEAIESDHRHHGELPKYDSVTVSHFLRSYTINHLEPQTRYKLCIAVKDDEATQLAPGGYLQLSCTSVTTQGHEFMLQGIEHTSNIAVALAALSALIMSMAICVAFVGARRYRHRNQYQTPEKSLLDNASLAGHCGGGGVHGAAGHSIPLEDIYSPLMPGQ